MGFMIYHFQVVTARVAAVLATSLIFLNAAPPPDSTATDTCEIGEPLTGGKQHCSSNASGKMSGDYTWTIWSSGSGGCMTTYDTSGCAFKATWNNSGDFLARTGLKWNETKTHEQIGRISADYAFIKSGSGGSWSFIGIYGWSNNPLVEYYIVEDWFGTGSAPSIWGGSKKGSFVVDGETYDIITHTQNNQPSIHGNATFPQYFSVRQKRRQCGHISISEHFKKWDSLGLRLGKMYEARILVEAAGGNGSIDFTRASLVVDDPTGVSPVPETFRQPNTLWENNCKGNGVLSLVSLTGSVMKSVRQNGSYRAIATGTMAKGLYILQFRGEGKVPVSRPLLVR